MNDQNKLDTDLLAALRDRPDQEPDRQFVRDLRKQLTEVQSPPSKRRISLLPVVFSLSAVLIIVAVLSLSLLDDLPFFQSEKTPATEQRVPTIEKETKEADAFEKIISSQPAFKDMYDAVVKETGLKKAGKQLVYFLEGVRTLDEELLSETMAEVNSGTIPTIEEVYHNVDYSTFNPQEVNYDEKMGRIEVVFSLKRGSLQQYKQLYLWTGRDEAKVEDPMTMLEWDIFKNNAVLEKLKEIEDDLQLGMSKTEAEQVFGKDYDTIENPDAEDGTIDDWRYRYLVEDDSTRLVASGIAVDEGNLRNQNVGIELFISWSPEGKAERIIAYYGVSGEMYTKGIDQNGFIADQLDPPVQQLTEENVLKLSPADLEIYAQFSSTHDVELLRKLDPLTIAKFYVKSRLEQDFETEYALHTTRPEFVYWSLEEHLRDAPQVGRTAILAAYRGLADGEFIKRGETEGHIDFQSDRYFMNFQMIQDENGIWKVAFMPTQ